MTTTGNNKVHTYTRPTVGTFFNNGRGHVTVSHDGLALVLTTADAITLRRELSEAIDQAYRLEDVRDA